MNPRIETLIEKKLIGKRIKMSLSANKTSELWQSFMPHRNDIRNKKGSQLYSVQIYSSSYFNYFNPGAEFEKWAAAEVTDFAILPAGMDSFVLPGGLYAVFLYKGLSTDTSIFQYIFGTWLPESGYELDNRPHFEILGEKFKNDDPDSEEEIWISVKLFQD